MKVIFLGCTIDFGLGYGANNTKISFMIKGLQLVGVNCVVHNGIVGTEKVKKKQCVEFDGVEVTTLNKRKWPYVSCIFNCFCLYNYLRKERKNNEFAIAVLEMDLFHIMLLYFVILKLLNYKIVVISHEWGPTMVDERIIKYISHCTFAKTFGWCCDGILPISEYIINKIRHFKKPYLKVPILADFNVKHSHLLVENNCFVYCASVYYSRIIKMIINSYELYINRGGTVGLILILNGPENKIKEIIDDIVAKHLSESIQIKSKLPYKELLNVFCGAKALLIPLNPNYSQDSARFSQKIAEYLSTKTPIITNKVGDIQFYFRNDEIITCEYSEEGFSEALMWVSSHEMECKQIGERGYIRGLNEFDFRQWGEKMYRFFDSLFE